MYGIVFITRQGRTYAAVSGSKRALKNWMYHKQMELINARNEHCDNWRMKDKSGWCNGGPAAWKVLHTFPKDAEVVWG